MKVCSFVNAFVLEKLFFVACVCCATGARMSMPGMPTWSKLGSRRGGKAARYVHR